MQTLFTRLYLDTNVLYDSWPVLSTRIRAMFRLAQLLEVELAIPVAVERELRRQMSARLDHATGKVDSANRTLADTLARIDKELADEVDPPGLHEAEIGHFMEKYDIACENEKAKWGIHSVPLTSVDTELFFEHAINRKPPFREKGGDVTGFQDAMIFWSILEEMHGSPSRSAAFLTLDAKDFPRAVVNELVSAMSADVKVYHRIEEVTEMLKSDMPAGLRETLRNEEVLARGALSRDIDKVEPFVVEFLESHRPQGFTWKKRPVHQYVGFQYEKTQATHVEVLDESSPAPVPVSFTISGELEYTVFEFKNFPTRLRRLVWLELEAKVAEDSTHVPSLELISARLSPTCRVIEGL